MSGHTNDQSSRAPFFDQRCYRFVIHTIFPISDYAQRASGARYVLTNGNANAA